MDNKTLYWFAGLLEGEGSFGCGPPSNPKAPYISIQMTDEDVISKVADILKVKYHPCRTTKSHHKPSFTVKKNGLGAVDWMLKLKPLMGKRRRAQIDKAIASCEVRPKRALNAEQQKEIRERMANGESYLVLVEEFGVNHRTIYNVRNERHAYANVA